eukprot:12967920-Ditylum_brightwellii.AAC.1
MEETVGANGTLVDQQLAYNRIINVEVQLQHQDHITTGKVGFEGFTTTMMEGIIHHDRDENTAVHMKD